ncbi:MAG: glutamate 5-kinase [Dehalococcoidia bacterium]|nr:MAG: glutamate 5-kinase [Dehalococcoidia bacterium]
MNSKSSLYKRIVIKLGTNLLTRGGDSLDNNIMSSLVTQIAGLHRKGTELVVVSSGAIAAGRYKLELSRELKGIPYKQVLASIGQSRLMNIYERLFKLHGITIAQALLTKADLSDRAGYLNARNTLLALLELRVLCIVNENDVVAVDEIQESKFGDNDNLSAMVANLIDADLLIMLTDNAGLYDTNPKRHSEARLITRVNKIDSKVERLAYDTQSDIGTGGMITKIEAAKLATASGVSMVIADGSLPDVIFKLAEGKAVGTFFPPSSLKLESRKRWMLSGLCVRGKLFVDSGAAMAMREKNSSLLAAGIERIEGRCRRGDIVNIYNAHGKRIGCGISNYSSTDIEIIKGAHSGKITELLGYDYGSEVVHRNNLVVF